MKECWLFCNYTNNCLVWHKCMITVWNNMSSIPCVALTHNCYSLVKDHNVIVKCAPILQRINEYFTEWCIGSVTDIGLEGGIGDLNSNYRLIYCVHNHKTTLRKGMNLFLPHGLNIKVDWTLYHWMAPSLRELWILHHGAVNWKTFHCLCKNA